MALYQRQIEERDPQTDAEEIGARFRYLKVQEPEIKVFPRSETAMRRECYRLFDVIAD